MGKLSEDEFAALIDTISTDPDRCDELADLLREQHPIYEQRGAATVVRMRGWILLALARVGVSDKNLLFVLEELDNGIDAYLVAAAACALRSYHSPRAAFAPFAMRALTQIRYRDEPLSFAEYGAYAVGNEDTSAVRELLKTLAWLGPHARAVLLELEALSAERAVAFSKRLSSELDQTLATIRAEDALDVPSDDCCALPETLASKLSWLRRSAGSSESIDSVIFEDQDSVRISFKEFFHGRPSILVFFYTRCDNPLKCSLTVSKLAEIQRLLADRGLADQINTAAISYDPEFDLPKRMQVYGHDRGVRFDTQHRILRSIEGFAALREHFKLGVNFIESLVNRHHIEAYILDDEGKVAVSFERLRWEEKEVVDCATAILKEAGAASEASEVSVKPRRVTGVSTPIWGTLASLGVAVFPKCPVCWAAYLSMLGIAGLNQIPYAPWLQPLLVVAMLINLASVWVRGWLTGRMFGSYLVSAGVLTILLSKMWPTWEKVAIVGVILTFAGSFLSAAGSIRNRKQLASS